MEISASSFVQSVDELKLAASCSFTSAFSDNHAYRGLLEGPLTYPPTCGTSDIDSRRRIVRPEQSLPQRMRKRGERESVGIASKARLSSLSHYNPLTTTFSLRCRSRDIPVWTGLLYYKVEKRWKRWFRNRTTGPRRINFIQSVSDRRDFL